MPHSSKEAIALAWCDDGMVNRIFMDDILFATINASKIRMTYKKNYLLND